jgi:hypothetical protein
MTLIGRGVSISPISIEAAFTEQFRAFHGAILDNCDQAACPDRGDAMALRLRANALGLTKMQLAMLARTETEPVAAPEPDPWAALDSEPAGPRHYPERILADDALSRFVSRPPGGRRVTA